LEKEQLREDLERLHRELSEASAVDASDRELLSEVLRDIETLLERDAPEASDAPASLSDRLRQAMGRFEESHPSLTTAVGRIADALASLGV
jgi:predicted component of type VI protein secretion system